jgi:hypothetical protein
MKGLFITQPDVNQMVFISLRGDATVHNQREMWSGYFARKHLARIVEELIEILEEGDIMNYLPKCPLKMNFSTMPLKMNFSTAFENDFLVSHGNAVFSQC